MSKTALVWFGCIAVLTVVFFAVGPAERTAPPAGTHSSSQEDAPTVTGEALMTPALRRQFSAPAPTPRPKPTPRPELVLKPDWEIVVEEFAVKIRGRVVNRTGQNLRYAEIRFHVYDKSGALLKTAMTNVTDLEAGSV